MPVVHRRLSLETLALSLGFPPACFNFSSAGGGILQRASIMKLPLGLNEAIGDQSDLSSGSFSLHCYQRLGLRQLAGKRQTRLAGL